MTAVPSNLPWLFSARIDLWTFLGSALLALGLLVVGHEAGWLQHDTPEWLWVGTILMIDVAHVYATGFRVYLDRPELQSHPWLYGLTPLLAFLAGMACYWQSDALFWRCLAYLAVFHFVRQQYGWVALYRARAGEPSDWTRWIDVAAIYAATIYPLLHWHGHLPRDFWWLISGDFIPLSSRWAAYAAPLYVTLLLAYGLRSAVRACCYHQFNPGKDIVVVTTAVCWYVGIVAMNSDYAFTVTNVITHGIPYLVLVHWYRVRVLEEQGPSSVEPAIGRPRWVTYLATVWSLAYLEEFLWDAGVWHERTWLFGPGWNATNEMSYQTWLVPLLAVPQITHYVLDGFIWKRRAQRHL